MNEEAKQDEVKASPDAEVADAAGRGIEGAWNKGLKAVLEKLEDPEYSDQVGDEAWKMVADRYGRALNKHGCPCGSEASFEECCKWAWTVARRVRESKASRERKAEKLVKEAANQAAQEEAGVTWFIQIGVRQDGVAVSKPIDGAPPLDYNSAIDLLMQTWQEVLTRKVLKIAHDQAKEVVARAIMPQNPVDASKLVVGGGTR